MVNFIASQKVTTGICALTDTRVNIGYMNNLGSNIRRRIRQLDITQREVSKRAEVSSVLISRLVSGNVKTTGKLPEIAAALGLTVEQLLSGDFASEEQAGSGAREKSSHYDSPVRLVETSQHEAAKRELEGSETAPQKTIDPTHSMGALAPWDSSTPLGADEVELPLFREVELAGGHGRTQVQENHGAKLRFARSTLARKGIDPSVAACCFVSGDSMARVLPNGSTVAVDTSAKNIVDGQMYAIDHGGLLRVKYLYRLPGGRIKVSSENRDYPDEILEPESLEEFRVVGRVFWYAVLL